MSHDDQWWLTDLWNGNLQSELDRAQAAHGGIVQAKPFVVTASNRSAQEDTSLIPVLALAEHWPDDAQSMIYAVYDERATQLEAQEMEARSSFHSALASRGGN